MCLFPTPRDYQRGKSTKSRLAVAEKKTTSSIPSHLEIKRLNSKSSCVEHQAFLSLAEHKRLEKAAEDEKTRAFEKAELEKYKAAEKAAQERVKAFEKSELERLQKAEAVAREMKRKEEMERLERLEKAERELKMVRRGGGKKTSYEDKDYGYGETDEEVDGHRTTRAGKLRRRRSILEEIDFIHTLGKKLHPNPPTPNTVPSTAPSAPPFSAQAASDQKAAERDAALQKLQSEFAALRYDTALGKAKAEGIKEGAQSGEQKVRKEIAFREELESDLLGRLGRERDGGLRARKHRQRIRSRSRSRSRSSSRDARVGKRRGNRDRNRERGGGGVDLEALANLPGRWTFGIESPEAASRSALPAPTPAPASPNPVDPYPLINKYQDRELQRLRHRVEQLEDTHPHSHSNSNSHSSSGPQPWEEWYMREQARRDKEREEQQEMAIRERVAKIEERQMMEEREKEWITRREEKEWEREWKERMLSLQAGTYERARIGDSGMGSGVGMSSGSGGRGRAGLRG